MKPTNDKFEERAKETRANIFMLVAGGYAPRDIASLIRESSRGNVLLAAWHMAYAASLMSDFPEGQLRATVHVMAAEDDATAAEDYAELTRAYVEVGEARPGTGGS